ncbi:MAG: trigger factor [Chitinispirillaceae bacterium]
MKATVSEPTSWKRVISIEVPEQEVKEAFDSKLNYYKKDMRLPGFRPGKVPASLIRQRYGDAIKAEIVDEIIQKSYKTACDENDISPIAPAKVDEVKNNEGEPLSFTVETEVDPAVEIKGYDKLKVRPKTKKIKDSDIQEAVENLRERLAEYKDVQRPSRKGDYVRFEYRKVIIDGQEQQDVKNPEYPVEIGADTKLKDFDKGLTGVSAGDVVDITVKFPNDYQDQSVAGKSGEFTVAVTAVQEKELPEVNEDFLKKVGNFENEEALREEIRKSLEQQEQEKAKNDAYNEAVETLIKENPFEVPPAKIEAFINYMHEESMRYRRPGEPEVSREQAGEMYRETAIRSLKRQRIIDYVADKEKIKATQAEMDEEIKRLAGMYNQDFENLKQVFRKNGTTNRIRSEIRERKTLDFLVGETQ